MGTDIFTFEVISRNPETGEVQLKAELIYDPEVAPSDDIYFAMFVLQDFLGITMEPSRRLWSMPQLKTPEERKKFMDEHPHPTPETAPPLNDEIDYDGCMEESWMLEHTSSYITKSAYDKKSQILTITPTHPGWTAHMNERGLKTESRAYDIYVPESKKNALRPPAPPLTPIDRSAPIEPYDLETSMKLGYEMKVPRAVLRRREEKERKQAKKKTSKAAATASSKKKQDSDEEEEDPYAYLPDKEIPLPTLAVNNYVAVPLPPIQTDQDRDNLVGKTVLYKSWGDSRRIGTICRVYKNDDKWFAAFYHESSGGYGMANCELKEDCIAGEAVVMKPRRRVPF